MTRAPVSVIDTKISPELVQHILQSINDNDIVPHRQGTIMGKQTNKRMRDCLTAGIPTTYWFAGMIWHHIERVNQHNFQLDITSFGNDVIQLMRYEPGGHYKWHVDDQYFTDEPHVRKLSFSLLLNDSYEGGEIQFYLQGNKSIQTIPKQIGQLVIFDSRVVHRVLPVKSGVREALVGWVVGPQWG